MKTRLILFLGFLITFVSSADPLDHWTQRTSGTTNVIHQITFAKGLYVAAGEKLYTDFGFLLSSPDASTWTSHATSVPSGGPLDLFGVTYGNNTFVASGWMKTLYTSTDGTNWTAPTITGIPSGFISGDYYNCNFQSMAFGNGLFVAALVWTGAYAPTNTIATSSDGINWTLAPAGVPVQKVVWCSNHFLALGSGKILSSTGVGPWTVIDTGLSRFFKGVTFGNGLYTLVGDTGLILTATNRSGPWTAQTSGTSAWLNDIQFAAGVFVAVGNGGTILSSPNGTNWTARSSGISDTLRCVLYANGKFVAAGWQGKILQSDSLMNLSVKAGCQIVATGAPGVSMLIQGSSDLNSTTNWQNITNLTLSTNEATWSDPQPPGTSARFYRAVLVP